MSRATRFSRVCTHLQRLKRHAFSKSLGYSRNYHNEIMRSSSPRLSRSTCGSNDRQLLAARIAGHQPYCWHGTSALLYTFRFTTRLVQSLSTPVTTSPVQEAICVSPKGPKSMQESDDGSNIPFDINKWTPGKVHDIKSPPEFKAFVMERSSERPLILMCKAQACRPCKVFSRTYARHAAANPEIIFLSVVGDETRALRRMMILLKVGTTPTFVTYRQCSLIHTHSGNSEEKLQAALDVAYATMPDQAQSESRDALCSVDKAMLA
jgi:hypothetical protein